ncbi:MAG: HypC/HybG/HupF family hydrogenase formation chaperone [Acidobacteriota bacterium]
MCLAIPGEIVEITGADPLTRMARVSFGGVIREASLAYVPEAKPGDYVLVHAGFALQTIDEEEARRTLELFGQMGGAAEEGAE